MHRLMHMDWPSRLVWGLVAWPIMIALAVLLSSAADPHGVNGPWTVAVVGAGEVLVAAVAVVFPIWALVSWAEADDESGPSNPGLDGRP